MQYEIKPTISDAWHSPMPTPATGDGSEAVKIKTLLNELQKKISSMSHWVTDDGQDFVLVSDVLETLERAKNQKEIQ